MEKILQNIPFLRLTIALIIGVIAGQFIHLNELTNILLLVLILAILFVVNLKYSFTLGVLFGAFLNTFFVLLGLFINTEYQEKPFFFENGVFSAVILETPVDKPNSFKSVVRIDEVIVGDSVKPTSEKVIVYFAKTPDAENLEAGDRILFNQTPQMISPKMNPYDFDFSNYYGRKKIYRQVYLKEAKWQNTGLKEFSLVCKAERFRNKLIDIYREQPLDSVEFEVLSALTLGYSRELDPETRRVFSSSGTMHVLSVSGLHVGIIFAVLSFMFGFLRKRKWGKWIFVCLVVSILWFYAFITGLSPSVLRASSMFSIYIFGDNMFRRSNIYNSLALTAFSLIIFNPGNLFDIGFQLSYAALFGIVFLQPKFDSVLVVKNKILKYFLALVTVSVAAQITTFPITSYYFGQFPTYFWISNLFIIPLTGLLTPLGILLLFVYKVPFISNAIAFILNNLLKLSFNLLSAVENLPLSVVPVSINQWQLILITFIILSFFVLLVKFRVQTLKIMVLLIVGLNLSFLAGEIVRQKKSQIIIYNNPGQPVLHLINGRANYIISEPGFQDNPVIQNSVNSTIRKLGLQAPVVLTTGSDFSNSNIFIQDHKIVFKDQVIILNSGFYPDKEYSPKFIYINPVRQFIENQKNDSLLIVLTDKKINNGIRNEHTNLFCTFKSGAYQKIW